MSLSELRDSTLIFTQSRFLTSALLSTLETVAVGTTMSVQPSVTNSLYVPGARSFPQLPLAF